MRISEAVATLLTSKSDEDVVKALEVCLKCDKRIVVARALQKGLEALRLEVLARVTEAAMKDNHSLVEMARIAHEKKTVEQRDRAMWNARKLHDKKQRNSDG